MNDRPEPDDDADPADDRADPAEAVARRRPPEPHPEGDRILWLSWLGTVVFVASASAAAAVESLTVVSVPVALGLFAIGVVVFVAAYLRAIGRSRTDLIGIGGLFFLAQSAPRRVQWHLLGSLAVEVVAAFATAGVRPYTPLAFGVMVPMYGLGLAGLWSARYGTFPPRPTEDSDRADATPG